MQLITINRLDKTIPTVNVENHHFDLRIYKFGKLNDYDKKIEILDSETFYLQPNKKVKIFTACTCNIPLSITSRIECVLQDSICVVNNMQIYSQLNNEITFFIENKSDKPVLLQKGYKIAKVAPYIHPTKYNWQTT
jgi:dUTPase